MEPVTVGVATLAFKVLEKPLAALYSGSTGAVKTVIKKWNAAGVRDCLTLKISEVEKVRTIFSTVPIPLSSFYYPSRVREDAAKPPRLVDSLDKISTGQSVLILGTVGQGKSVLMRYLCVQELRLGKTIPIFIELRALEPTQTIRSKIIEAMLLLGFVDTSDEVVDFLLSHGSLVLFLDGFDELKRELALAVQSELAILMTSYSKTRWVISSRPGSLSGHVSILPAMKQVTICPLTVEDFDPFLTALDVKDEPRGKLIKAIVSSPGEIKGVLRTPLMLTLLHLTFGTSTHIPDTLHEFYESMFLFLVFRHDETKPGYVRQKATHLSNAELQDAFENFCFLSKDYGVSLTDEEFAVCAKNAAKLTTLNFTSDGIRTDLRRCV